MDSYENEASKFAAQRTKLKNICEAHDLTYTFIKNSSPINTRATRSFPVSASRATAATRTRCCVA